MTAEVEARYGRTALTDMAEIEETASWRRANELLRAGYPLLAVFGTAFEVDRRPTPANGGGENAPTTYIRHNVAYVIGRPYDAPPFPTREPRPPASEAAPSTN